MIYWLNNRVGIWVGIKFTQVFESGMINHDNDNINKFQYTLSRNQKLWVNDDKNCSEESFPQDLKNGLSSDGIFGHFNKEPQNTLIRSLCT